MLSQKLLSIFLLLLLFFTGRLIYPDRRMGRLSLPDFSSLWDGTAVQPVENAFSESFVGRDFLCGATATLQTALGRNQQNGCFYSEDGILQNLPDADAQITENNLQALQTYAAQTPTPCYFLLSPTAAAIAQNKIPALRWNPCSIKNSISNAVTMPFPPPSAPLTDTTACFPINRSIFLPHRLPSHRTWLLLSVCRRRRKTGLFRPLHGLLLHLPSAARLPGQSGGTGALCTGGAGPGLPCSITKSITVLSAWSMIRLGRRLHLRCMMSAC